MAFGAYGEWSSTVDDLLQRAAQVGAPRWMDRLGAPTLEGTAKTLVRLWQQELGMCVLQANAHLLLLYPRYAKRSKRTCSGRCHQIRRQSGPGQRAATQRSHAGATSPTGAGTPSWGSTCAMPGRTDTPRAPTPGGAGVSRRSSASPR